MDREWCEQNCPYQQDCGGEKCKMCGYIISRIKALEPQKVELKERKVLVDDSYDEPVYSIDKFFHCPRCNKILSRTYEMFDIRFCSNCGQAVEWD